MATSPFMIGAALTGTWLGFYADWLREGPRDLEIQDFMVPGVLDGDWRGLARTIAGKLDGFEGRRGIHGPFYGFPLDTHDALVREVVKTRLDQALDVCGILGASQMVVHSPVTAWDHRDRVMSARSADEQAERCRLALGDALVRAEDMGVTLVMETIEDIDPAARAGILAALGSPALKLSIDTGHAQISNSQNGAPSVAEFVRAAGEDLHHVHLQDLDGSADRHWPPGEGCVDFPGIFNALVETGATPHMVLELADHSRIPDAMAYLTAAGLGR